MNLFSEKVLISNRCISGLIPNLIKKSWTDSSIEFNGQLFQRKYGRKKTGQFCPQFVILNLVRSEDMPDFLS